MKTSIAFLFLIIAVIAVSALFRSGEKPAVQPVEGLPWQIEILSNGETRVFGLIPARSTLDDARRRFGMDMETVARLRQRAVKAEYMDGTTRKYILHPDDLALAWRTPIAGITFIPAVSLDEQTVLRRFGVPGERIRVDERVEHFLYPEKGLDLALDNKGKEVLQYVAPRQFARLREPLVKVAPVTTSP